jgi:hypothetical protein
VPDQDAWFGLIEAPAFGLLTPVVVAAQRRVNALADIHMTWNNSADRLIFARRLLMSREVDGAQNSQFWFSMT